MSTQIAQLELPASGIVPATVERATAEDALYPERPLGIAKGIASAVLIATPFWALFAFVIYLMI